MFNTKKKNKTALKKLNNKIIKLEKVQLNKKITSKIQCSEIISFQRITLLLMLKPLFFKNRKILKASFLGLEA